MNHFNRSLCLKPFANLANEKAGNWWKDLLRLWHPSGSDGGLRLALRSGKLNFYAKGQSVAEVTLDADKRPCASVHVKYAVPQSNRKLYLRFNSTGACLTTGFSGLTFEPKKTVAGWMTEALNKSGEEKQFVDSIVSQTSSIIDLEMGLPSLVDSVLGVDGRRRRPDKEGSGAPRVDLVCLERALGGYRVVFWEVKLVGDKRLRTNPMLGKSPEVVGQLKAYETFFEEPAREKDIKNGYVETCRVLASLLTMAEHLDKQRRQLSEIVQDIIDNPKSLAVDKSPRLLIYKNGRTTSSWPKHLERLRGEFNIRCFEVTGACDLTSLSGPQQ